MFRAKSRASRNTIITNVMMDRAKGKRSAWKKKPWKRLTRAERARTMMLTNNRIKWLATFVLPTEEKAIETRMRTFSCWVWNAIPWQLNLP